MGEASRRAAAAFKAQAAKYQLGDGPVDQEYHDKMTTVMSALDALFNGNRKGPDRDVGLVLLVFQYGEGQGQRCNFMSNGADRKDIVCLMKEMIARFEGQPEMEGHA